MMCSEKTAASAASLASQGMPSQTVPRPLFKGILGLLLDDGAIVPKEKPSRVSVAVVEEMARLKALYVGFHARQLARIIFYKLGERIAHKTAQRLWHQSTVTTRAALPLGDYHAQPDRYQARRQVIKLYTQGRRLGHDTTLRLLSTGDPE